jgi:hypothetical protein
MAVRHRFTLAYVGLALAAGAAVLAFAVVTRQLSSDGGGSCTHAAPRGVGLEALRTTTALWVTDVVMRQQPRCGYSLATRRLRGRLPRAEWAAGKSPVQVFVTRYPVVAYANARPDSPRTQAVYAISRRLHDIVRVGVDGTYVADMAAGLAAPDGGLAGYNLVLRLEDGSWHVDRCWRVRI